MKNSLKWLSILCLSCTLCQAQALESSDRNAIVAILNGYADEWNGQGEGQAVDPESEIGKFVQEMVAPMMGKQDVCGRHVKALSKLLKGIHLMAGPVELREVGDGEVVADVEWKVVTDHKLFGKRYHTAPFTHYFVKKGDRWVHSLQEPCVDDFYDDDDSSDFYDDSSDFPY